jgi:hypothetical protein
MQPVRIGLLAGQLTHRSLPQLGGQDEDGLGCRHLRAGRLYQTIAGPRSLEAFEDGGMRLLDGLEVNNRAGMVGQALLQRQPGGHAGIEPEDERVLLAPGWGEVILVDRDAQRVSQHLHKVGLCSGPIRSGEQKDGQRAVVGAGLEAAGEFGRERIDGGILPEDAVLGFGQERLQAGFSGVFTSGHRVHFVCGVMDDEPVPVRNERPGLIAMRSD